MLNKQRIVFTTILFLLNVIAFAQKGTKNPYSVLGIGELQTDQYAAYQGMGNISMAATDSTTVNENNPASYSYLARHLPILQVAFNGKFSSFETKSNSSNEEYFGLNQFQLGLPIAKKWGASVGLKPYSFRGYTVASYTTEDNDTTGQFVNEGSGAISKVFLGLAYRPINFVQKDTVYKKRRNSAIIDTMVISNKHQFSFGSNINYFFGTVNQNRSFENLPISFEASDPRNSRAENSLRMSDVGLEYGVNYILTRKTPARGNTRAKSTSLSIGASFIPGKDLRSFENSIAYAYSGSYYEGSGITIQDTSLFIKDNEGSTHIPEAYKFGVEYRKNPTFDNRSSFRFGADVNYQAWSKYETTLSENASVNQLNDRLFLGTGIEYTPAAIVNNDDSYVAKISYRLGLNYTMLEYSILNDLNNLEQITNYGMSFGFGLPLAGSRGSNSNLNLGFSLGNLGTTENGLIRERYLGVYLGFSMTPGYDNAWFRKRLFN